MKSRSVQNSVWQSGREVRQLNLRWKRQYGYSKAVRVDENIHLSGQVLHDEHASLVAPAPLKEADLFCSTDLSESL